MARPTSLEITRDLTMHHDWPAPRARRAPAWARVALPVAALTLLVAVVRVLGGFERREPRTTEMAPGQAVVLGGVLELTPYRALAKARPDSYEVTIEATCRNLTTKPLLVWNLPSAFVVAEPATRLSSPQPQMLLSPLNPGLQPKPCPIRAIFPQRVQLRGTIALDVQDVVLRDPNLIQQNSEMWLPSGWGDWLYLLPLTVQSQ